MPTYYIDTVLGNDSNAGTSAGSGNAWATIQKFVTTATAGDKGYVKASGNYNELVTITAKTGTETAPFILEGYTTTPGDNGRATIDAQNTRNNCILFSTTASTFWQFKNFVFQGSPSLQGLVDRTIANCNEIMFTNCRFTNGTGTPLGAIISSNSTISSYYLITNCEFDNLGLNVITNLSNLTLYGNTFRSSGSIGTSGGAVIRRNLFVTMTGTTGISLQNTTARLIIDQNTFYNNSTSGFNCISAAGSTPLQIVVTNNIFSTITGLTANAITGNNNPGAYYCSNNAFFNCTNNYSNVVSSGGDVILSANPFTSTGTNDFSLNSTAGGGAACKGVATPSIFPFSSGVGTTSSLDIGAVQSASAGGVAGLARIIGG